MADFDVALENLLAAWEPRLGRATCGPGCDRCCRRMTVLMTSAEGLGLIRHPAAEQRRRQIRDRAASLPAGSDAETAVNALLDQGACVFLDNRRCSVHPSRPDGCRAAHVWHESWYCGREDYDQCVPAELNGLRVARVYERMLGEIELGRRPFWGFILPVAHLLAEHADAYRSGEDLADCVPDHWLSTELVEFPSRERLLDEQADHRRIFAEETAPLGSPRAADAESRAHLAAFPVY